MIHHAEIWRAVTNFGDSALLVPVAAWVAIWLWRRGQQRMAVVWGLCVLLVIALVSASKVAFMGWGIHPPGLNFTGFSGHSAMSLCIWPVAGVCVFAGMGRARGIGMVLGYVLAAAVATSRVPLHAHSVPEAVLGATLGAIVSASFLLAWRRRLWAPMAARPAFQWLLLVVLAAAVLLTYGDRFPSESILQHVARTVSGHKHLYTRAWLRKHGV